MEENRVKFGYGLLLLKIFVVKQIFTLKRKDINSEPAK